MADKAPKPRRKPAAKKKPEAPQPDLEAAAAAAGAAAVKNGVGEPADIPPQDEPPQSAPKPKRRRETRAQRKLLTQQIEEALEQILTLPAIPSQMLLGDQWLADHFATQGKMLAHQIAEVSERNEVLRDWCRRALEGESIAVLLMASLMYVYPPLLHFGLLPGPAGFLGVPVRGQAQAPVRETPFVPETPPSPGEWPVEPIIEDEPEPPAVAV